MKTKQPLSEVSTEELRKMSEEAFSKYYAEATKPCGDWQPGMTFPELEEATQRLNEINDELERRMTEKKEDTIDLTGSNKVINVHYMSTQSAEDLFVSVDNPRRVYVRQPANVDNLVFWHTSSKWQGGYEADCPIRADITMRVVDKVNKVLFEETLKPDDWNGGTSAEKKGPFSYEAIKALAAAFEKTHGLKPYEAWRDFVLQDKEVFNNTDYNDNWMYWHVEKLEQKILDKAEVLGQKCCFVAEKMRHKISGREWTSYELMDEKRECTLALCGYEFQNVLLKEPLCSKIDRAEKVSRENSSSKDIAKAVKEKPDIEI